MLTAKERLELAMMQPTAELLTQVGSSPRGLSPEQVEANRETYGENVITKANQATLWQKIYESIINPFTVILLIIALVSLVTNVILAEPGEQDPTTPIIIIILVIVSGAIRFFQELKSDQAASNLSSLIVNTATVIRDGQESEVPR